jgi:hypothetical protein
VFGTQAEGLSLEQEGTLTEGTRRGHSFRWTAADPSGVSKQYFMNVFDRVTQLRKEHKLAEDFQRRSSNNLGPLLFSIWFAATLLLFSFQRVYAQLRRREAFMLALIGVTAGGIAINQWNDVVIVFLIGASLVAGWVVITSATACFMAQRPWPHVVAGYLAAVRLRPRPAATGLAVARGAALGLLILGARASLVRAGVATNLTWPQPGQRLSYLGGPFPVLTFVGENLLATLGLTFMLVFVLSLGRRLTAKPVLLTLLGGACWAIFELGTVPIDYYNVGVTFVVAAAFALVLIHFDMLTLLAAALTADLWGNGYTLLSMFELVGNTPVLLLLVAWGIAVAAAIYFGFGPLLQRAGRQAAQLVS